ncbi:MAG TPA: protein kinase [Kofleriaceae bacterium]|nr:protein kinase [Kofleriaceae bacterium]
MTELPTTFGKYFLTEKLATGGMAEIYLGKLVGPGGFEKQLVIKQIHPKLSGQRHFVDLFVAEAKTLVTLAHGNIVPVYELGVIDDTYFIAMEYIDGPTLYRLTEALAKRSIAMEPAVAAWIAAKILEGLDYAHHKGEGVIHRDLSPRNVMLSRDGEVKLVDFGIAVTLGAADEGPNVQSAPTGSFPYMSPEQVRREPLSGQTDLFSVGVLLWEMLVGHRLFARSDPDATLAAVTGAPIPRPSAERADVPAKLDEVVMRALERDRDARWSSAAEMLGALQRYLYGLDATPGPRDVAALVARFCPPETRRIPTHADGPTHEQTPPRAGPSTAVLPGAKKRARTETFATHVQLEELLLRATPLFPVNAIREPEPATEPDTPPPAASARIRAQRSSDADARPAIVDRVPGRRPPSRAMLVLAAIGTIALGLGALYVFFRGRNAVLVGGSDASALPDAPYWMIEADAPSPPDAAPEPDALDVDAASVALDAAPIVRDAGHARADAAVTVDAAPRATGTGKLVIGANPWGEIVIDGVPRGRTPREIEVPAGKHVVDVIFKGEDPPRKKSFAVTVGNGDAVPVQADFTQ